MNFESNSWKKNIIASLECRTLKDTSQVNQLAPKEQGQKIIYFGVDNSRMMNV